MVAVATRKEVVSCWFLTGSREVVMAGGMWSKEIVMGSGFGVPGGSGLPSRKATYCSLVILGGVITVLDILFCQTPLPSLLSPDLRSQPPLCHVRIPPPRTNMLYNASHSNQCAQREGKRKRLNVFLFFFDINFFLLSFSFSLLWLFIHPFLSSYYLPSSDLSPS